MTAAAITRPVDTDLSPLARWFVFMAIVAAFFVAEKYDIFATYNSLVGLSEPGEKEVAKTIASGGDSLLRPAAFAALAGVGGLIWLMRPSVEPSGVRGSLAVFCIALVIYATSSVLWAEEQNIVVRRIIIFLLLCAGAYGIATGLHPRGILQLAFVTCGTLLLIGAAAEIGLGGFRPWVSQYRFNGLTHPNNMGGIIAIALIGALGLAKTSLRKKWLWFAALILFVFVVLTKSRGAMAGLVAALWVWWFLGARSRKQAFALTVLATALIGPLLLLALGDSLDKYLQQTMLLGRQSESPETLTGRLPLWQQLMSDYVAQRPAFGYGFDSFWSPRHVVRISAVQNWTIVQAHSSYLSILLDLGVVGLTLFLMVLAISLRRSYRYFTQSRDHAWLAMMAILVWGAVSGIVDAVLLTPTVRNFVMMIIVAKLAISEPEPAPLREPAYA